jgi:hypothetical protein
MTYSATHVEEIRALRSDRERVSELLGRYPRLSNRESREILKFMRTARHLDIGLLTRNERLRARLDAFMRDHKSHFRMKWAESAAIVGGILLLLTMLWLLWGALHPTPSQAFG